MTQTWLMGRQYVRVVYRVGALTTYDIAEALRWTVGTHFKIEAMVIGASK
jgi:hypothetical protein